MSDRVYILVETKYHFFITVYIISGDDNSVHSLLLDVTVSTQNNIILYYTILKIV